MKSLLENRYLFDFTHRLYSLIKSIICFSFAFGLDINNRFSLAVMSLLPDKVGARVVRIATMAFTFSPRVTYQQEEMVL